MVMCNAITEQVFRIITAVKDHNTVVVDIEVFQIFEMLNGGIAFRGQISVEGSMNDIVVK